MEGKAKGATAYHIKDAVIYSTVHVLALVSDEAKHVRVLRVDRGTSHDASRASRTRARVGRVGRAFGARVGGVEALVAHDVATIPPVCVHRAEDEDQEEHAVDHQEHYRFDQVAAQHVHLRAHAGTHEEHQSFCKWNVSESIDCQLNRSLL